MEKALALLVLLVSCFPEAIAQNSLPPVYEIKTDTTFLQILPQQYWQMLPDKGGKLKIDDENLKMDFEGAVDLLRKEVPFDIS